MRVGLVVVLVLGALGVMAPGRTAVVDEPFSVPPTVPGSVPPGGRYIDRSFTPEKTAANVQYGVAENSRGETERLLLDVWEPKGDAAVFRPAMVYVHGGYFKRGDKSETAYMNELVKRGYVGVSINYRLRPELPEGLGGIATGLNYTEDIPYFIDAVRDAQHDTMAAIRWVRANATALRVDASRVVVAGHSAGGLTTMMVVFNYADVGESGNAGWSSTVAAGLPSAGAYGPVLEGPPAEPFKNAPLLTMHGTHDTVVPHFTAILPCVNTIAVGNVCEQRIYPGAGHGLPTEDRGNASADFLYRHVIGADQADSDLVDLAAATQGEAVTVTGRLVDGSGAGVAGARVLGSATAGWAEATTGPDGSFTLAVAAPDHGRSTLVTVRYEGDPDQKREPVQETVTATWGPA